MDLNGLQNELMSTMHRFGKLNMGILFDHISKGEFIMLNMIAEHMDRYPNAEGISVSELAGKLCVSSPAVSRMLRTLEEKELIERKTNRTDRRNTYISLTPKGKSTRHEINAALHAFSNRVILHMGKDNIRQLISMNNQMFDTIEEELKKIEKGDPIC